MLYANIGRRPKRSATGPVRSAPAKRPASEAPASNPIHRGVNPNWVVARLKEMPMIPRPNASLNSLPELAMAARR